MTGYRRHTTAMARCRSRFRAAAFAITLALAGCLGQASESHKLKHEVIISRQPITTINHQPNQPVIHHHRPINNEATTPPTNRRRRTAADEPPLTLAHTQPPCM